MRQRTFEWSLATQRAVLARLARALKGRSIPLSDNPKDTVGGKILHAMAEGIFVASLVRLDDGSTVSRTTRNKPVGELVPGYCLRSARKALAVLRSPEGGCCVAEDKGRQGHSPAVDLWLCWPELLAWVEQLESTPVPVKTRQPAATVKPVTSTQVHHPKAHHSGAGNPAPEPPTEGLTMVQHSAAEPDPWCSGCTVHGAAAAPSMVQRLHRPLYSDRYDKNDKPTSSSLQTTTDWEPAANRRDEDDEFLELQETLSQRLGVDTAQALLEEALTRHSRDQVRAILDHAVRRELTVHGQTLKPWGAGAVRWRLLKADSGLPPGRGWATPRPEWKAAFDRQAKAAADAQAARTQAGRARVEGMSLAELEAAYGPLVPPEPRDQRALLPAEEQAFIRSREDLRAPRVRKQLLLAVAIRQAMEQSAGGAR